MRIAFQRSFAQFSDNYLATYYGGGVRTFSRLIGGPLIILGGALLFVVINTGLQSSFFRFPLFIIAIFALIYGAARTLLPLFNLFLVWLRRDQLFSAEQSAVSIELLAENLNIKEGGEQIVLPITQIKSLQHRADSTWILTEGDVLIAVPREGLIEGDHDAFFNALEEIFYVDEEADN